MTRFSKKYKELVVPAAILSASVMGAGMFSLPYLFNKAGFATGLFYLVLFVPVLVATHFLYSEVVRNTPGDHRLLGYARIYLGLPGWIASALTTGFGLLLVFTIFLALSSSFLKLIFPALTPLQATLIFWVAAVAPLFLRVGKMAILESIAVSAVVIVALGIFVVGILHPVARIPLFNQAFMLLPYGAVLFAMYGRSAVSAVMDYAAENNIDRGGVRRAIILGTVTPVVVYVLFVIGAILLSNGVSVDTVSGLAYLPRYVTVVIGCLGVLSLWESSVALSRESTGIFAYDAGLNGTLARLVVAIVPLLLYLLGLSNFAALVGIVGGIFITLEGTMVILMWQRARNRRPWWSYAIIFLFLAGALYEVFKII
ncbi:MAG: hypothetical protein M1335_00040 [Chloroflexi bacterium]|nr:hypothetical protein [Chloroflexota bacterium]